LYPYERPIKVIIINNRLTFVIPEYRIGAGGWGYFDIPGADTLKAYSKAFDFVEVNSTFYNIPTLKTVDSWAKRVPVTFKFSVKCHHDLTHKFLPNSTKGAGNLLEVYLYICRRLHSNLLVLETPRSFNPNQVVDNIHDLLSCVQLDDIRLVWEIRWGPPGKALVKLMQEFNIVHSVDLSRESGPAFESDILYSRLFGHGLHNLYQFDDNELLEIDKRVGNSGSGSMYLSFHGGRMYKDAARLKVYRKGGKFPRVTEYTGVRALGEVLQEDARFPASREELIAAQGWKVIDVEGDRRIHAEVLLTKLDKGMYGSVEEVVEGLEGFTFN
jgi:uncharacterized protein YecE (DUF72 family)